jgi:hypothetical protein
MERTDIHRPSAINPSEYEFVGCEHARGGMDGDGFVEEFSDWAEIRTHMESTGGHYFGHEEGGPCDVCGSTKLIWSILYHHAPSNAYVRVGADCAYKLGLKGTDKFNAFKKRLSEQAEVYAGKQKAKGILAEAGLTQAWDIAMAEDRKGFVWEENTITDIVGKLIKFGSVSDKQLAFLGRLIEKIATRQEREAARKAENEAAEPFPLTSERIQITGEVLSTKMQESDFGAVRKMLVRSDAGWKVWVTCPGQPERGNRVSFFAKVEPSRDDPKFGFGSRPTKFQIINP